MGRRPALALAAVALAVAPSAASADDGARSADAPAAGARAGATVRLSDERTLTRWAHAYETAPVRARPRRGARVLAHLRYQTEDGPPEVYLVLETRRVAGRDWLRVRVPGRPNGRTGWVPRAALGPLRRVQTALTVDRATMTATLRRGGRVIWRSRVGVGAPATPTPAGRFWIRERLRGLGGSYGPWAFGTSAYSNRLTDWPGGGVIGIHGTDAPGLIPGRPSHGCIRVPNPAVRRLARLMPIGTPVRIR